MKTKKIVKLKDGDVIKYNDMHPKYGKAEFAICPIFKYGKLKKVLIYPRQQETDVYYYEIECHNQTDFQLLSWTHKGYENPWTWMYFYCKEHKCLAMNTYVPLGTDTLSFNSMSSFHLMFDKAEDPNNESN